MKRLLLLLFLISIFLSPQPAKALEISLIVRWEMQDTSGIKGYRVYYASEDSMTGKQLCGEATTPTAAQLTISNINIDNFPIYLSVAAVLEDNSEVESFPYALKSPTDGGETTIPAAPTNLRIVGVE